MFKFLMMIFLVGFILFSLLGFSVLRSFRDFFLGSPKSKQRATSQSRQSKQTNSSANRPQPNKKKIIEPDEGEYVDYEEIKE